MNNKTYDYLKWITMVVLPAIATLYAAVAAIWHLPHPGEITATITALVTFLGVVLGVSSNNYEPPTAGTLFVNEEDGSVYAGFEYSPKHLAESGDKVVKMGVTNVTS